MPTRALSASASVTAAALAACLLSPGEAQAGGISLGRFGGIYGNSNADGGLALYWNPAHLSLETGAFATVDTTLVSRRATYDREIDEANATPAEIETNSGRATTSALGVLPLLATGYTAGFDGVQLGAALGAFPTFGGFNEWDQNEDAPEEFPGALDGPQRWSAIAASLTIVHYTLGASVTFPDVGLSFGVTGAWVDADLDTVKARNLNKTDALVDDRGAIQEGRIHFRSEDREFAWSVGAGFDDDHVRASISYRAPYDAELIGPARQAYATNEPSTLDASLDFPLPGVLNMAVTPRFGELEVTWAFEYQTWSRVKSHDVFARETGQQVLEIPRSLKDTVGTRIVPTWLAGDRWRISALVGHETSAVPRETLDASLADSEKVLFGLGGGYDLGWLRVLASVTHDAYFNVDVSTSRHEPTTNGKFRDARDYLNVSIEGRL